MVAGDGSLGSAELRAWHARPGSLRRSWPAWLARGDRGGLRPALGGGAIELAGGARAELVETASGLAWECRARSGRSWRHPVDAPVGDVGEPPRGNGLAARIDAFHAARIPAELAGDPAPLQVVVSGASGLVGSELTAFLSARGHGVRRLVRRPSPEADAIRWSPAAGEIDAASLEGVDAIVHLAGENIAAGRWTERRRARILDSRVDGTRLLARAIAGLRRPPAVFVSASAIGFYGDTADRVVDEDADPGQGFLAEVCQAWEAAAEPARQAGVRVVHPRLGIVLSAAGGVLARLAPVFRAGLGGPVGSGRQGMSWIASDDVLDVLERCMTDASLAGPLNAVSPEPVSNRDFGRALGRVLGRPALVPLPALAVRLAFGEMGEQLLLAGQRVRPAKLLGAGFGYRSAGLEDALCFELGLSRT